MKLVDLGHLSLDIKEYRDIWFKTLSLDQKQAKTERHKRVLKITKPSFKLYFPAHFTGKKPAISAEVARPKAAIIREKGVTPNEKWQMLCI
jgi:phosphoribosylformylglycinamidine synthase